MSLELAPYQDYDELMRLLQERPQLEGTEKQAKWAQDIWSARARELGEILERSIAKAAQDGKDLETRKRSLAQRYLMPWKWWLEQDAHYWINWRSHSLSEMISWASKQRRHAKRGPLPDHW
jgi:hypothetical protein